MSGGRSDRIASVIQAYDEQGWHRTGTAVDAASGEWLAAELQAAGADARLETYPFRRLDPEECSLTIGATRIDGLPMFDGGLTGREAVAGRLGPLGSDAEIQVAVLPAGGAAPALDNARQRPGTRAIVCFTAASRPGLAPRNATAYASAPGGTPVLQVSSEFRDLIEEAAARHDLATVPGSSPGLSPVVVMTPRSGWWQCASERGGGIAVLLELARMFASERPRRPVIFLASTGHELGHWGLERFLNIRPYLATSAPLWLHLGASVGAALEPRPMLFCSSDAVEQVSGSALDRAGLTAVTHAPRSAVPGGESKNIHERGGSYASLLGGSAVFHLEADRWPDAVDVDAVASFADAASEIVRYYAST